MYQKQFDFVFKCFSMTLVFLSDPAGNMHTMGTPNSAIKNYACLPAKGQSDMRLDKDAKLEKLHFHILSFSCVCWGYQEI